jgi:hypothetical protein
MGTGEVSMADVAKERWLELCEQASKEQNTYKLLALVTEINQLLKKKKKLESEESPASNA